MNNLIVLTESNIKELGEVIADQLNVFFQTHMVEKPMTREKAAEYMSVSVATFDRMRKSGVVKDHLILGTPLFLPSELLQVVKGA